MIIDTHIHLSHPSFQYSFPYLRYDHPNYRMERGTREDLLRAFQAAGIAACIDPAIDPESNGRLLALAEQYPGFLFPAVGLHPSSSYSYPVRNADGDPDKKRVYWSQRRLLRDYAAHPAVIAIGETGLDYHVRDKNLTPRQARREQHRFRQKLWFIWLILLADEKKLPLILHIRAADRAALRILRLFRRRLHGGVCHCFCGTPEEAKQYVALGLKLGIGGSLLRDEAFVPALEQAVIQTPLEDILLETDGPFRPPACPGCSKKQLRKWRNTSLILPAVIARIAELKGVSPREVERITTANAVKLFALPGEQE